MSIPFYTFTSANRRFDDVGFYDSVCLKRTHDLLTTLTGAIERPFIEDFDGDNLSVPALASCGVAVTVGQTPRPRARLLRTLRTGELVHVIDTPLPRVAFVPDTHVRGVEPIDLRVSMKVTHGEDFLKFVMIDAAQWPGVKLDSRTVPATPMPNAPLRFECPTPDKIITRFDAPAAGVVRILEAFDAGWRATLDGRPAPILIANGGLMAVAVPAGPTELTLEFYTPGRTLGVVASTISLAALIALSFVHRRGRSTC